ncbi:lipoprotein [Paracoccus zhejiangensis]|nr:lipoprotein [Paracoccus zhejiangensis]
MKLIALIALAALAACGVDGPPERPVEPKPQPGVTVSGEARIGMQATL